MSDTIDIGGFTNVEMTGQQRAMLNFLDWCELLPQMPPLRTRSLDLLGLSAGRTVLDVGCGVGTATAQLADRGLSAIGVDASPFLIEVGRSRHPHLELRVGTAEELPVADASVDGYRAERVYQHLRDPLLALREAKRVLVPGGRLVLVELDADIWAIDASDVAVTRALGRAFADTIASPLIGRKIRALLLDEGFGDVNIELHPLTYTDFEQCGAVLQSIVAAGKASGAVTADQGDTWLAEQRERSASGQLFVMVPMFVAAASR